MAEREVDFRRVCEHNYDPIHITDGEGNILFINEAYPRITGIAPEIYLGRNIFDVEREGVLYKGSVSEQVIRTGRQVNNIAHIHGKDIDVLVTQGGIAVNPARVELRQRLLEAGLPVVDIHELKEKTERITGVPRKLPHGDRVVAEVIGRNGDLQDQIYSIR